MSRRGVVAVFVLMCCAISVRAQWPVDSAKKVILSDLAKYHDAMLVIDGVAVNPNELKVALSSLTQKNVFDIIVLSKDQGQNLTFNQLHDVIVVVTKAAAISYYKTTLAKLSPDYRNYLDANNNNDGRLQYILNSLPLENKGDEIVNLLYRLSPEKITNVALTEVNGKKTVIIDIKVDE